MFLRYNKIFDMQNGAKMKFYFLSFGFEILPKIPSHYYLLYDDEKNKYYMLQTCLVPFMRQFKFWGTPRVSAVYHARPHFLLGSHRQIVTL